LPRLDDMAGFSISRDADEYSFTFTPPLKSRALQDALQRYYPSIETHQERKAQAIIDFCLREQEEQKKTRSMTFMGTVRDPISQDSFAPETPFLEAKHQPEPTISCVHAVELGTEGQSTKLDGIDRIPNDKPVIMTLAVKTFNDTSQKTKRNMDHEEQLNYRYRRHHSPCNFHKNRKRKVRGSVFFGMHLMVSEA
jgi:hypothetical protein